MLCGTAIRRNFDPEPLIIAGKKIPKGAFLAYTLADVHMNEEIYPQANKFDPGRFESEATGGGEKALTFLGWGAGMYSNQSVHCRCS